MAPRVRSAWWFGVRVFSEDDLEQLAGGDRLERARRLVDTIDDLYEDEWSLGGWATTERSVGLAGLGALLGGGSTPQPKTSWTCSMSRPRAIGHHPDTARVRAGRYRGRPRGRRLG